MQRRAVSAVVEDGSTLPLTRARSDSGKNNKNGRYSTFDKTLAGFTLFNVLLFVYLSWASDETVLSHREKLGEQLAQMTDAIHKQHEMMTQRLKSLSSDVEEKEKELEAATAAEEELESKHNEKYNKEIEELKKQMEELRAQINTEKGSIEKVKEEIKEQKEEVEEEKKNFCESCRFSYSGLVTTCGKRRDYLVSRYGNNLDDATESVVKWDPNCLK